MYTGTLISDLVYASYRAQRDTSPKVAPERWGRLECFEEYTDLEARYQRELAARAEADECIAGIGTDATGENGFPCGNVTVAGSNYCADHYEDETPCPVPIRSKIGWSREDHDKEEAERA